MGADIAKLAQDVGCKRQFKEDDGDEEEEGAEDTDGSDIEDMTVPTRKGKSRQSPAKSSKKESATRKLH